MEEMGHELARNSERRKEKGKASGEGWGGAVASVRAEAQRQGGNDLLDSKNTVSTVRPSAGHCAMMSGDGSTALTAKARPQGLIPAGEAAQQTDGGAGGMRRMRGLRAHRGAANPG